MSLAGYRRITVTLLVAVVILLAALWNSAWQRTYAKWDAKDARLSVRMIEKMRYKAVHSPAPEAALCLQEIVGYRADWNWQRSDLRLGELVDSERTAAIRDVIEHLKRITGEDLGETPDKWIENYLGQNLQP